MKDEDRVLDVEYSISCERVIETILQDWLQPSPLAENDVAVSVTPPLPKLGEGCRACEAG